MENNKNNQSIDIFDILIILAKRKKFLIISLMIVSVLVVTYSLLVTQTWTSVTNFKTTSVSDSQMSMISSVVGGDIGSLLGGSDEGTEIVEIVNSRNFLSDIIEKYNIVKLYEIEDEDPNVVRDEVLKLFRSEILSVNKDPESGIITLIVTTIDKHLSANIANDLREKLGRYLKNDRMTKGKEERQFLEKRVSQINEQLEEYTLEMKEFQEENNVLELESQLSPMLSAYTDLVASYQKENLKYQLSNKFIDTKDKKNELIKFKRDEILKQIKKIEHGNEEIINYQVGLNKIPEIAQKYALLKTKMEILKKTYETIYPQYELARLQELRDTPTVNTIDEAVPAGLRTWPSRALLCIGVFIVAFITFSLAIVFIEFFNKKMRYNKEFNEKIKYLRKEIIK